MASGSGPSELEVERDRLANAVRHLEDANVHLTHALREVPGDLEFRQAIGENIVVLAKYRCEGGAEGGGRRREAPGGLSAAHGAHRVSMRSAGATSLCGATAGCLLHTHPHLHTDSSS
jgi:hypothetical protein